MADGEHAAAPAAQPPATAGGRRLGPGAMTWLLLLLAVAIGALFPIQAAINSRLRPWVGGPLQATLVSVLVSTSATLLILAAGRRALPDLSAARVAPWWVWTGGLFGVAIVLASLALVTRLGAAFLFALVVLGQMLASLLLDHFGLFGVERHAISPLRVLGAVLLLLGVVLIRFF